MTNDDFKVRFGTPARPDGSVVLIAAALIKAESELAELRSVNHYQRGYTDGYAEAERKFQVQLDEARKALAALNHAGNSVSFGGAA